MPHAYRFDEAFERVITAAAKFNREMIKMKDLARSDSAADEAE